MQRKKNLFYYRWVNNYNVPRLACSLSILSNKALKLPAPNPFAPIRWIISKNKVGLSSTGFVKIYSK